MSIRVDKYSEDTNCITHSGVFHADEVLGTVILEKALGDLLVARVAAIPSMTRENVIVYDIGHERFDHHQPGGNGCRDNGVDYASAGLLWKTFGPIVVKNSRDPEFLWRHVDECLIQGVDAADNGSAYYDFSGVTLRGPSVRRSAAHRCAPAREAGAGGPHEPALTGGGLTRP